MSHLRIEQHGKIAKDTKGKAVVGNLPAEQVLVDLERVQRSRLPWWRRLRDVMTFGSRWRKKVRA